MLGLNVLQCRECATVVADPAEPPWCPTCGHTEFDAVQDGDGAAAYFAPTSARRE